MPCAQNTKSLGGIIVRPEDKLGLHRRTLLHTGKGSNEYGRTCLRSINVLGNEDISVGARNWGIGKKHHKSRFQKFIATSNHSSGEVNVRDTQEKQTEHHDPDKSRVRHHLASDAKTMEYATPEFGFEHLISTLQKAFTILTS